jgi:solute carrier family 34 (sodium-dependent phosphate cotransporter)
MVDDVDNAEDRDGDEEEVDERRLVDDVTWQEVFEACCCHTPYGWGMIFVGVCCVILALWFFMFALDMISTSSKVMTGCVAGEILGSDTNPVTAVVIGLISTALIHSSSTTTSIVVSLVPDVMSVQTGIYVIMGANIGTTVTNTMVSLAQMGNADELERAFGGAVVHDVYNVLSVIVMFPLEWAFHLLKRLVEACTKGATDKDGEVKWEGPSKQYVSPVTKKILVSNSKMMEKIAANKTYFNCDTGGEFYPTECDDPSNPRKSTCGKIGLVGCDKKTDECPAFFQIGATAKDDKISGGAIFFVGLCLLFIVLAIMVLSLKKLLAGSFSLIIKKSITMNPYLAMVIGCLVTMLIQSSSVVTSALTPMVGVGLLDIEQMYALTIGANLGTTLTAIMASTVSESVMGLQVALAHMFFNIFGIFLFYPIPWTRRLVIDTALALGRCTRIWRGFPILFIFLSFFVVPLFLMGVSAMFEKKQKGLTVIASFLVIFLAMIWAYYYYVCKYRGGKERFLEKMKIREHRRVTMLTLPDDMDYLKERAQDVEKLKVKVDALVEYTGLPEIEETPLIDEPKKIQDSDEEVQA